MELLGVVGEYAAELRVYQLHFGVKPCRYPSEEAWALRPADAGRPSTGGFSELGDEAAAPPPAPAPAAMEVDAGPSAEDVGKMKARVRRPFSSLDRAPSNWTRSTTFSKEGAEIFCKPPRSRSSARRSRRGACPRTGSRRS